MQRSYILWSRDLTSAQGYIPKGAYAPILFTKSDTEFRQHHLWELG